MLSVRGLITAFRTPDGWKDVIRNIAFDVNAGETLAIVGESGSGKSVTSLSIMRLNPEGRTRTQGEVKLLGTDLLQLTEDEMSDVRGNSVAMIFQERVSHRGAVMYLGEILESGSREAVFADARYPFTRRLLAARRRSRGCPAAPADTAQELNSPVRDLGCVTPVRRYETVAADHIVRVD